MIHRKAAKFILRFPILFAYILYKRRLIAFLTVSRLTALIPGIIGLHWRIWWYELTLNSCGKNFYIDWMSAIKTPMTSVGNNVFIGPSCWIGWASIGDDVMLGGHITILSGARHHSFDDLDTPMNMQKGSLTQTVIGSDVWIGNRSVVMSNVSPGSVVAAGSVVNKEHDPFTIIAGCPAKVLRSRGTKKPLRDSISTHE